MCAIKVQGLTKAYGNFVAVNKITFNVEKGTMLGFLGVNGAGKSTTIHMLSTLLTPDGGTANLCGCQVGKQDGEIRRKIGIVYQQNCLDGLLSVQENLICRGVLHGITKQEARRQLGHLNEILKMGSILKKKYRMLSGGEKRRCEIAAALMHTPEILFLDEPTTGLDPATRSDVWEAVGNLRKEEKITVFLTTHYMEEAAVADKIVILDHGNIIASGTPFALKEKFASDKLRLYFRPEKQREIAMRLGGGHKIKGLGDKGAELPLGSTKEAIPVIEAVKDQIDGFEVIQGNMDDVFLNAVNCTVEGR